MFIEIAATMATIGVNPVTLIAGEDPEAVTRAVENGCEMKRIQDIIEHVNVKMFNDKMCARNQSRTVNHMTTLHGLDNGPTVIRLKLVS